MWNVTLTLLTSLDVLHRTLSASMSRLDSTMSRNSTLSTPTEIYSLRYSILLDASPFSEKDLVRAITTATVSGNLTSAIRESDPSLSGMYLSGSPSLTVTSYNTESTSPPQSNKSTQISYIVWVVVGLILGLLMLGITYYAWYRHRRSNSVNNKLLA